MGLHAFRAVSYYCDVGGCISYNETLHEVTVAQIREQMRNEGWTRRNGKDYCPDHSRENDERE